jgi:hypothetical protein
VELVSRFHVLTDRHAATALRLSQHSGSGSAFQELLTKVEKARVEVEAARMELSQHKATHKA